MVVSKPISNEMADQVKSNDKWVVPTNGTIEQPFSSSLKGIEYTGKAGQDIYAVNDGKVLYSDKSKGYGNLIIIKHDKVYLSAYANNQQNLVKEGDLVKRGQKIAIMGVNTEGKAFLHFEIRKNGNPINPNLLLK